MRHAEWIASRLLEDFGTAPRGAVYVLSGNMGDMYPSLGDYVYSLTQVPPEKQTPEQTRTVVQQQVDDGAVIVQQSDYGKLIVYSKDRPVPVSSQQFATMQVRFNVIYGDRVGWSANVGQRPIGVDFEELFGAQKAVDQELKAKEKLDKQAEKADKELKKQAEKQAEKGGGRQGIETEHGSWFNPPGWKKEFKAGFGMDPDSIQTGAPAGNPEPEQQNPYDIGIEPDPRYRRRGVLVARVYANSAASASVLQAGDIIRAVGPFETRSGVVVGPYRVDRPQDLQRTLSWLRGGTAFPLKVVRGSNYVNVVVMPQIKRPNAPKT